MKHFIRGMGVGIILTTIIFAITYGINRYKISDEEVVKRAKRLGMVQQSDNTLSHPSGTEAPIEDTESVGGATEVPSEIITENDGREQAVAVEGKEAKGSEQQPEVLILTIEGGDGARRVGNKLVELGVITNVEDFVLFLQKANLEERIRIGSFEMTKSMQYSEIVKKIIK